MAHTPGPWKVSYYAATRKPAHRWTVGGYEWVEPYGATVCEMSGNPERAEANAHLIAADPDLLAALRAILTWDDMWTRGKVGIMAIKPLLAEAEAVVTAIERNS